MLKKIITVCTRARIREWRRRPKQGNSDQGSGERSTSQARGATPPPQPGRWWERRHAGAGTFLDGWTGSAAAGPHGKRVPSRVSATSGSEQARGRKGGEDGTDLLAACAPALAPREESIGLAGWCAADVPLKKVAAPGPHEEVPPGCGQEAAGRIAVAGKRLFLGAEEEHGIEAEGCPRRAPGARDRVAT